MSGAERHPGKLPEQIRFLGCQRCSSVYRDRILSIALLDLPEAAYGKRQSVLPTRLHESGIGTEKGIEQTVRMIRLKVTFYALGAKHPAVERKILPRLEANH